MANTYFLGDKFIVDMLNNSQNNRIIFVGAGISKDSPSSLPLGEELTKFYLQSAIGEKVSSYVLDKWDKFSQLISAKTGRKYPIPRLEIVIDNVNKVERKMDSKGIINGFNGFLHCPSNSNHKLLYHLAQNGAMILTANFDTCIENAYGNINHFKRSYDLQCPIMTNDDLKIYHFHGIPDYYLEYDLGATLENIKNGFPESLGLDLEKKFLQGWQLIFVGYSGCDFFDVTPFFQNLPYINNSIAICFSHKENEKEKPSTQELEKYGQLLKNFKNSYIVYGDTTDFLRMLCNYNGLCENEGNENKGNGNKGNENGRDVFDWKYSFQKIVNDRAPELQELMFIQNGIRILNQIDLNYYICYPDWEKQLKKILDYYLTDMRLSRFFTEPDMSSTVIADIKKICKRGIEIYPEKAKCYLSQYEELQSKLNEGRRNIIAPNVGLDQVSIEYLLKCINKREATPQNYNSRIVYAMNMYTKSYIQKWINCPNDVNVISVLHDLSKALDKMLTMPYSQYMYLSYYTTLLKAKNLITAILQPEDTSSFIESKMLEISMEINCTTQTEKVFKNLARKQLILHKILGKKCYSEKAEYYYSILTEISKICERECPPKDIVTLENIK